jgi:8-oxo-dGTP diphosphatase
MSNPRFQLIPEVQVILRRGPDICLLRRFQTGYEDGKYGLPAGHIDGRETARGAGIREAREEVGVTVAPEDMRFVHVMHRSCDDQGRGYHERVAFFFVKCDEVRWCDAASLPPEMIGYVREGVRLGLDGRAYSEHGWDLA